MNVTYYTIKNFVLGCGSYEPVSISKWFKSPGSRMLQSLRNRLEQQEISDRTFAHRVCRLIPAQCPFERKIEFFGYVLVSIPPLCKLNPLYEDLMSLRFRALCYLAEEWGEDISQYC
ncbi:Mo-dependent nitrogenase C-terminal domain-containing protein [Crocosphaera chwakensis]|uniref:Mo-dependent nitrogenase-like protein n=1 Tax=Crocosphaera chwakensis CCY0110 TaxID=391612 RepID=A3IZD3_9CHRO|nr:Mo-dependent nitrogenase C-terminal domain-containing protein [Crocosphaera chwakensis]EAZ88166.1 Mo-dependent nitrogenase-like protein [Crocosphaera chwakensis CCY0110]